jgi:hypothetical protein
MSPAGGPDRAIEPEAFPAEFDRIEAAVDAGETDLGRLGFWRLLARVKADPALSAHWAEQAGRIDRKAFEARFSVRFPVWFGNLVLLLGVAAGVVAIGIALATDDEVLSGLALVFASLDWSVAFHGLGHWLVGRLVGMRFFAYVFRHLVPPVPGLKVDYASYLRTSPEARAWMHASGAIASKLAPFVVLAFWPASPAPTWVAWAIAGYGGLLILIDVFISTRKSDWKRVSRELRVARQQAAR